MNPEETAINQQPELTATLAELVAHLKRPNIPADDELWTCEDVAAWLKLAPDTVARRVVTRISIRPSPTISKPWFSFPVIPR